jgi:hypothetical protein
VACQGDAATRAGALELNLAQLEQEARRLKIKVDGGDMGPGFGAPPVEDIAFDDSLTDPETAQAARDYLAIQSTILHVHDQIEALRAGGPVPLPVFFVPKTDSGAVQFPVCLAGALGDVHVTMPMVFVADIDLPNGLLHPSFTSLTDEWCSPRSPRSTEAKATASSTSVGRASTW